MQNILKALGILLFIILGIWIGTTLYSGIDSRQAPSVLAFGDEFTGATNVSQDEVNTVFTLAKKKLTEVNHHGTQYARWGKAIDWFNFGLTAVITLIAGFHGKIAPDNPVQPQATDVINEIKADMATADVPTGTATERPKRPRANKNRRDIEQRKRQSVIAFIGFLAALASVCTGASSRLNTQSAADYKKVDDFQRVLVTAREELSSKGTTDAQAQDILENITQQLERL